MEKHEAATFSERHPILVESFMGAWRFSLAQLIVSFILSSVPLAIEVYRGRQTMSSLQTLWPYLIPYLGMFFLVLLYNFFRVPLSILTKHHFKLIEIESRLDSMSSSKVESINRKVEAEEIENLATPELRLVDYEIRECFMSELNTLSEYEATSYLNPVRVAVAKFRLEPTEDCPESIDVRGQIEIFDSKSKRAKSIFDGVWFPSETGMWMQFLRGDVHGFTLGLILPDKLISYKRETQPGENGLGSFLYPELEDIPGEAFTIKVTLLAERRGKNRGQTNFSFDLKLGETPTICLSPGNGPNNVI
jgi:hypothetical protein